MAIAFYPVIKRDEFESFRRVIRGNFPTSYDEWENFINDEVLKAIGQKFEVVRPEISFEDYVAWLASHGDDKTLHGLKNYAAYVHNLKQD